MQVFLRLLCFILCFLPVFAVDSSPPPWLGMKAINPRIFCIDCGVQSEASDRFCGSCGQELKKSKTPATIPVKPSLLKMKPGQGLLVIYFQRLAPYDPPGFFDLKRSSKELSIAMPPLPRKEHLIADQLITYQTVEDTYSYPAHARSFRVDSVTYGTSRAQAVDVYRTIFQESYLVPEGTWDFKISKGLNTGPAGYGRIQRRKIFRNVTIVSGKVSVLTHFWKDNSRFGENLGETASFRSDLRKHLEPYGDSILSIYR